MMHMLLRLTFFLMTGFATESRAFSKQKLQKPNGYLLALKAVQIDVDFPRHQHYNHVSLFNITLDGGVTELWNISLNESHQMFDVNMFAVDLKNCLVYIPVINQFLAVDLHSGQTVFEFPLEPPNLQYFISYDYSPADETIYGMCTGNSLWNWCSIKQHDRQNATVKFLFQLPFTNELSPTDYIYNVNVSDQTIWYYPSFIVSFAICIDCRTGKTIYASGPSNGTCVSHDLYLNRTFAIVEDVIYGTINLTELQPTPKREKVLLELPSDLRVNFFGTCVYDQKTHTFIGLMGYMDLSKEWYHSMPTALLLIDVVNLKFERIPLPQFMKKWDSANSIDSCPVYFKLTCTVALLQMLHLINMSI